MGGAIISGIIASKICTPENICVFDTNKKALEKLDKKICKARTIEDICACDIVFLAVKPNVIYGVIDKIKGLIGKNTVVVSIAAGQSLKKLTYAFEDDKIKLVRVMPNTPALVGEAMSAVALNDEMSKSKNKEDAQFVLSVFESFGKAEIVDEKLMDVVTGVSGSSPAYIFMLIEAMADAAVLGGMARDKAYTFAAQSVLGSAKMVLECGKHPAELKDMVCSPGGTTIEAVKVLEDKGFKSAVIDAIDACIKKSQSL